MKSFLLFVSVLCLLLAACGGASQPAAADSPGEKLFIITYDGLRWQEFYGGADSSLIADKEYVDDTTALKAEFWAETPEARREKLLPFFWSTMAKEGQLLGNRQYGNKGNCSNQMWFSFPGYNEILSGFADDARISSNAKTPNPNRTFLEFVNGLPEFQGKMAAFGSWDVFPYIINEERSGVPVNAGFEAATGDDLTAREVFLNELQAQIPSPWGTVRLDAFTHHFALEYLKKHQPRVIYISYGETDDFAHDGEYDAYLHSARRTDAFIRDLWNWAQSNPAYKGKTTFLITTDHGRGTVPKETWKHHGKSSVAGSDEIWFAAIGPRIPALGEVKTEAQWYQNQVANTAAAVLGITYESEKPAGPAIEGVVE